MPAMHGCQAYMKYVYNGKVPFSYPFSGCNAHESLVGNETPKRHLLEPNHVCWYIICIGRAPWVDGRRAREEKTSHGPGIFHLYGGKAIPGSTAIKFGILGDLVNVINRSKFWH